MQVQRKQIKRQHRPCEELEWENEYVEKKSVPRGFVNSRTLQKVEDATSFASKDSRQTGGQIEFEREEMKM